MSKYLILALFVPSLAWAQMGDGSNSLAGGGSVIDRSGTITTGSTSQIVMAANAKRVYCEFMPLTADIYVSIDNAASGVQGSYKIPAGSLFKCPLGVPPTGKINVWSTTAGSAFTATEYQR